MDQINNMPRPEGFSNKEFFLRHDNLKNVTSEIVYSAFRRYNCLAGCKVCYTAEQFKVHDTGFGRMVPTGFDNRYNDLLFNKVFPFFYTRSTIDDLFWMNQKYKNIYNWYIEHQKEFVFGNMTDNNFIRTQPLLMKDFSDTKIYEISFSDEWLQKVTGRDLVKMLDDLHNKFPIIKIKVIQQQVSFEHPVIDWARSNEVGVTRHYDVMNGDTMDLEYEQALNFCSEDGFIYAVCGEADYLQYDSFFLSLVEAIDPKTDPYDTLWDPKHHLSRNINAKKKLYKSYADKLRGTKNKISQRYVDYFDWVTKHVHVNDDYNYIPVVALDKWNYYYPQLSKLGWTETEYGLVKPDEKLKPLYTISN